MEQEIFDIIKNSLESMDKENFFIHSKLYGDLLDSVELVFLVSDVESIISEKYNKNITIVSEKAMSQKNSPFLTINSLVEYIKTLLDEK